MGIGHGLKNPHPGDILRDDFLVVASTEIYGLDSAQIGLLITGSTSVTPCIDVALTRHFGMTEGFFFGLQLDYDAEEARS